MSFKQWVCGNLLGHPGKNHKRECFPVEPYSGRIFCQTVCSFCGGRYHGFQVGFLMAKIRGPLRDAYTIPRWLGVSYRAPWENYIHYAVYPVNYLIRFAVVFYWSFISFLRGMKNEF